MKERGLCPYMTGITAEWSLGSKHKICRGHAKSVRQRPFVDTCQTLFAKALIFYDQVSPPSAGVEEDKRVCLLVAPEWRVRRKWRQLQGRPGLKLLDPWDAEGRVLEVPGTSEVGNREAEDEERICWHFGGFWTGVLEKCGQEHQERLASHGHVSLPDLSSPWQVAEARCRLCRHRKLGSQALLSM